VQGALGLNTRPCAKRRKVHHENTTTPFWTIRQMANAYGFPPDLNAEKQVSLSSNWAVDSTKKTYNSFSQAWEHPRLWFVGFL